ncbi:MAG: hypothetical protein A2284_03225 [Deltaproteobacteria bacterium RIFOXYA12_FULL_61_11]|nr:MAG: hypothetical protein A2284_03225 [Deltaproteobacteria bacterium RIFOXYA12_FULL_61_11]
MTSDRTEIYTADSLPSLTLRIFEAGVEVTTVTFTKPNITLGSSPRCDIQLQASVIDPQHLLIRFQGGTYHVRESSQAGLLLLNGQRCSQAELREGDQLGLGPYLFLLGAGEGEATTAEARPLGFETGATPENATTTAQALPRPPSDKTEIAFREPAPGDRTEYSHRPDLALPPLLNDRTQIISRTEQSLRQAMPVPPVAPPLRREPTDHLTPLPPPEPPAERSQKSAAPSDNLVLPPSGLPFVGAFQPAGNAAAGTRFQDEGPLPSSMEANLEAALPAEHLDRTLAKPLFRDSDYNEDAPWHEPFSLIEALAASREDPATGTNILATGLEISVTRGEDLLALHHLLEFETFPEPLDFGTMLSLPLPLQDSGQFHFLRAVGDEYFFFWYDGLGGTLHTSEGEFDLASLCAPANKAFTVGDLGVYGVKLRPSDWVSFTLGVSDYAIRSHGLLPFEPERETLYAPLLATGLVLSLLLHVALVPLYAWMGSMPQPGPSPSPSEVIFSLHRTAPEPAPAPAPPQESLANASPAPSIALQPAPLPIAPPIVAQFQKPVPVRSASPPPPARSHGTKVQQPAPTVRPGNRALAEERPRPPEPKAESPVPASPPPAPPPPLVIAPSPPPPAQKATSLVLPADPELERLFGTTESRPRRTDEEDDDEDEPSSRRSSRTRGSGRGEQSTQDDDGPSIKVVSGGSGNYGSLLSELTDGSGGGSVDTEKVQRSLVRQKQKVFSCMVDQQRNLSRAPKAELKWQVNDRGKVTKVKIVRTNLSGAKEEKLKECLKRAVKSMEFPDLPPGTVLELRETFELK